MTLTDEDLSDVDPTLYRSLQWILENSIQDVLAQDYAYEMELFGSYLTIPIAPHGKKVQVSDSNKKEFVRDLTYSKLIKEIEEPLKEFKRGLFELVPKQLLEILLPSELSMVIAGEAIIDVGEMRKHATLQNFPNVKTVNWFWEVVEEFDQDQLSNFMFFVTGSKLRRLIIK